MSNELRRQDDSSNDMWHALGFRHNPYDFRPLQPTPEDAEMLVGRNEDSISFATILDSGHEGVCVISGKPGVGKTSFFNIQQYRSATGLGAFGPRLLTAEQPCTIRPDDAARDIARRVLEMLIKSLEIECHARRIDLPEQSAKIAKWAKQRGSQGFDLGITIAGFGGHFGRSSTLPSFEESSYEAICDAITATVAEVVTQFEYDGVFMPLDNIENLDDNQLADLLVSFRDTLFAAPRMWWVLIGQSGLGSLIQTIEPRVWERISGTGLELEPLSISEVHKAIERRVQRFSLAGNNVSPLPIQIHEKLYSASQGELRYTLKKSTDICIEAVADFRRAAMVTAADVGLDQPEDFAKFAASRLVNGQIPVDMAEDALRAIVAREIEQLGLSTRERRVLRKIAERGEVRPKDYESMGFNSMQSFQSNFLAKFHTLELLYRRQEGKPVYYGLRGIALMAADDGFLEASESGGSTDN